MPRKSPKPRSQCLGKKDQVTGSPITRKNADEYIQVGEHTFPPGNYSPGCYKKGTVSCNIGPWRDAKNRRRVWNKQWSGCTLDKFYRPDESRLCTPLPQYECLGLRTEDGKRILDDSYLPWGILKPGRQSRCMVPDFDIKFRSPKRSPRKPSPKKARKKSSPRPRSRAKK